MPRNDAYSQVFQPSARQVEWAANLAVQGALTVQRPANWKGTGLPAYSPQGMFPRVGLLGGGRVPAQILLGVLAAESNLWQASGRVVEGVSGNPLVGDLYGWEGADNPDDELFVNWAEADCGSPSTRTIPAPTATRTHCT